MASANGRDLDTATREDVLMVYQAHGGDGASEQVRTIFGEYFAKFAPPVRAEKIHEPRRRQCGRLDRSKTQSTLKCQCIVFVFPTGLWNLQSIYACLFLS